jgi:hypothetical protein
MGWVSKGYQQQSMELFGGGAEGLFDDMQDISRNQISVIASALEIIKSFTLGEEP